MAYQGADSTNVEDKVKTHTVIISSTLPFYKPSKTVMYYINQTVETDMVMLRLKCLRSVGSQ